MRTRLPGAVLVVTLLPAAARAQTPVGGEFRANTFTTSSQFYSVVASDAAGNFVVVWASYAQEYSLSGAGVFARRYLASGAPVSANEFRVNAYTTLNQKRPAVASDALGGLVVAWESDGQDGDSQGVFARRYDPAGAPGPEFRVNTHTTARQELPAVDMAPDGRFVVVWQSYGQDGSFPGIFGQRYDAAGAAQGPEFRTNTFTAGIQQMADVAMDTAGNFLVVWASGQDGSGNGIFGQRYDAAGTPQGVEFQVNTYTTGNQDVPSVGADASGNFVVAWRSQLGGAESYGVFARRYDPLGAPLGGELSLNELTANGQSDPSVAVHASGGFVVAWTDLVRDGGGLGVFARAFDASGTPQGGDFRVNTYTTNNQTGPSVAATGSAGFAVTWSSRQDGDVFGVYGQRFALDSPEPPDLIFRDDFESGNLSAWSASQTDSGDLSVSSSAAMKFTTAGLRALVDDTAGLYVEDATPANENAYRARFYFDTNGFDPGEALNHRRMRLFLAFEEAPLRRLAAVVLRRLGSAYSVMGRARLDDNSQHDSGFFAIAPGPHFVEIAWKRATGPVANDGQFELRIDGILASSTSTLDNSLSAVDLVRLGALSVKTGAAGTLYLDEFESRRNNVIGP